MKYYAGIEGGATHSSVILLDEEGNTISSLENQPPTNHWNLGMKACVDRIGSMLEKLLRQAELSYNQPLAGLGLCLSGCEEKRTNDELKKLIKFKFPFIDKVEVESDVVGPILSASATGGIVLIAGTGSNLLLVNPDKTKIRCGGLSYLLGDQGSAWWIAHKAVRACILHRDNFKLSPYPIDYVWSCIKKHFHIEDDREMLKHCYQCFNKPFYAKLTVMLAEGAINGDDLCRHLFFKAGEALAMHVLAIRDKIAPDLYKGPLGLPIVCIGSVWKSWKYLQKGFCSTLGITAESGIPKLTKFSLVRLVVSPALGAALLSAPGIPQNYPGNSEALYSFGL